uniref:GON domain-containing protein n=1 Tax=Eptatretus burgeri TaxID=7764 RepID=A0A8C4QGB3_EPTBU
MYHCQCSQACGGGIRTRLVACQTHDGQTVDAENCDATAIPVQQQCNQHPCIIKGVWEQGTWSPCSVTCKRGVQRREVRCVTKPGGSSHGKPNCNPQSKPRTSRQCRPGPCPRWRVFKWGQCAASCGEGTRRRRVVCRRRGHGRVDDLLCNAVKRPVMVQRCGAQPCPLYTWHTGDWQECNQSCGTGTRKRSVTCEDERQQAVTGDHCNGHATPQAEESCTLRPCQNIWITGDWSQCSVSCERGYQYRLVFCAEGYGGAVAFPYGQQPASSCPTPPPPDTQPCHLMHCSETPQWYLGAWSPCSVTCGHGHRRRSIQCRTLQGDISEKCVASERPTNRQSCSQMPCDVPTSCSDVQNLHGVNVDGDFLLLIGASMIKVCLCQTSSACGRELVIFLTERRTSCKLMRIEMLMLLLLLLLQIHCTDMESQSPTEYLTLTGGEDENYSEVFGFR